MLKQGKMIGYFVSDQQSDYQSKRFMSVMDFVQKQSSICKIKEKNQDRLETAVDNVSTKSLGVDELGDNKA
jgi:transcription-repair coupling factor (superfamily II helicase)